MTRQRRSDGFACSSGRARYTWSKLVDRPRPHPQGAAFSMARPHRLRRGLPVSISIPRASLMLGALIGFLICALCTIAADAESMAVNKVRFAF